MKKKKKVKLLKQNDPIRFCCKIVASETPVACAGHRTTEVPSRNLERKQEWLSLCRDP